MNGIMFKEPLFDKITDGEKTQTRRVVKDCNGIGKPCTLIDSTCKDLSKHNGDLFFISQPDKFYKPRYKKGERVYLKEPYCMDAECGIKYRFSASNEDVGDIPWKNKMFMPESAARYYIEITDVRVEIGNQISLNDSIAEGFKSQSEFIKAIDEINGAGTSEKWMFVYEFKLSK